MYNFVASSYLPTIFIDNSSEIQPFYCLCKFTMDFCELLYLYLCLYLYFLLIFQSFFCPERRTGEKFGLPSSLSVLSENPEIMGSLLSLTVRYLGYIIVNMHWIRIKLCLGRDRLFKVRTSADLQPTGIYIYIYIYISCNIKLCNIILSS